MNTSEAITTHEAAKVLGVSYRTVQDWIKQGRFPHAYKLDPLSEKHSHLRIPIQDIDHIFDLRGLKRETA